MYVTDRQTDDRRTQHCIISATVVRRANLVVLHGDPLMYSVWNARTFCESKYTASRGLNTEHIDVRRASTVCQAA